MQGTQDLSLGREDALEKGMATHSIAWRIPWTEESVGPVHRVTKELDTTEHACGVSYHTPLVSVTRCGTREQTGGMEA